MKKMPDGTCKRMQVLVGNLGKVLDTNDIREAGLCYEEYAKLSRDGYGRVAYENVTLVVDGEVSREWFPELGDAARLESWIASHPVDCQSIAWELCKKLFFSDRDFHDPEYIHKLSDVDIESLKSLCEGLGVLKLFHRTRSVQT